MVHVCHGLPLPGNGGGRCMPPWTLYDGNRLLTDNGAAARASERGGAYREIALIKMLPLLREINERMHKQMKAHKKAAAKKGGGVKPKDKSPFFVLYSAHDTTIDPLLAALDIGDGVWPPYASRLVVELVARTRVSVLEGRKVTEYYIRALYNGDVITNQMSFCGDEVADAHIQLCPLEAFSKFVDVGYREVTNGNDLETACHQMD